MGILSMLICGLFFPLLITGIAQATMPYQANGSIVKLDGKSVGSYYIDNGFSSPMFFHARNESNPMNASASGVDPDINIGFATSQISGISNATGISTAALTQLVTNNEEGVYWIIGSPYVNVLNLNLKLISQYPTVYANFTSALNNSADG
jgi:potassium-transporting ATPase KdpC subunit